MPLTATIANALWFGSNLPSYWRFRRALYRPGKSQGERLRSLLGRNCNTAFGKTHGLAGIKTYEEFVRHVPLADYSSFEPWIDRIRQGETNILTVDAVTHLIPTSGSTGARKLIPFTSSLQREFDAAIGPWLVDLMSQTPGLWGGPAYWSISPVLGGEPPASERVPIGFETDLSYLSGNRRRLAAKLMAVPAKVGRAKSLEAFQQETLLHLLRCRELRLISVWHPAFLSLLLTALQPLWESLVGEIERGSDQHAPDAPRAEELRRLDPSRPSSLWPQLRVISCWGGGAAASGLEMLRKQFPNTLLQPKGLIATEAFVSLPFGTEFPLAINSHFFEFLDDRGRSGTAEMLLEGREYEVVITTGGGLWRYRLGDRVLVTGFLENTPSLKFLGREASVSDRFGEKLSEEFVVGAIGEVVGKEAPCFLLLAPDEDEAGCRYTIYVEGPIRPHWPGRLDEVLRANPHYDYCRRLGQLLPLRAFAIRENGFEAFARRQVAAGIRLGDVKPVVLSQSSGWSDIFSGAYLPEGAPFAHRT